MAIPTSRTREAGTISIDREKCNGCGLCVEVCKDFGLEIINGKAVTSEKSAFGCIGCGHCMMICPQGAITVTGRFTSPDDMLPLPERSELPSYDRLFSLLKYRRSIREFKDRPVPEEIIQQVIAAARIAPMGIPPSDVNVMILDSKEKNHQFAKEFCNFLETLKWMVTPWGLVIVRLLYGRTNADKFRNFIKQLIEKYTGSMKEGVNNVTYDAPALLYFYGDSYSDPADPYIAATYAMLAAESLGLGTCMIGGVHPFIQSGPRAKKFREKWGIRKSSKDGLMVIMGYPRVKYHSSIDRTFANVDWN